MTVLRVPQGKIQALQLAMAKKNTPAQSLTFVGSLAGGNGAYQTFTALCGPNPPQQTDGWAQWSIVARPEQVGMTVNTGYNPVAMDVQVRFEGFTADYLDTVNGTPNKTAQSLENDMQKLVWMTGRGKLYAQDGGVGTAALGDSPIVRVYSADSQGNERPLIPPDFQDIQWVISALSWDDSPIRNKDGYRVRQDVTVSLLQYVQDQFSVSADSSAARAKTAAGLAGQYRIVTTSQSMATILQVANQIAHDPTVARQILMANKDVKGIGTSTRKPLYPPPVRLRVPVTAIKGFG